MFDTIDIAIMNILQSHGRISNAEIARQIDMAPSGVLERIRKLEKNKVIQGYTARIDQQKVKCGLLAFVHLKTTVSNWSNTISDQLAEIPEILEIHEIVGEDCYLLKIRVQDTQALSNLLKNQIGAISNVLTTQTTLVLNTVKETTQLKLKP